MPIVTYPASRRVRAAQEYYRIFQEVQPGDLIPIDAGVLAVAIGPKSDIPSVRLYSRDDLSSPPITLQEVSVGAPAIGRIGSTPNQLIPGAAGSAGSPGVLLATPSQIVRPNFSPTLAPLAETFSYRAPVYLDLLCYFKDPASLPAARSGRDYNLVLGNAGVPNDTYVVMPFYGRNMAYIFIQNNTVADAYTVTTFGHNFIYNQGAGVLTLTKQVDTAALAFGGGTYEYILNSTADGRFDMISVEIAGPANTAAQSPPPITFRCHVED